MGKWMEKKKILLADGDGEVIASVRAYLKDDYEIISVMDGNDILPVIRSEKIDLMVLDLDIPHTYFFHILNKVREMAPELPVIVTYVYFDTTQELEAMVRKMCHALILKPFNVAKVKQRIDSLLKNTLDAKPQDSPRKNPANA